ncbi:hypothetical protein O181_087273 [Austropuccinia psidii MF-1]|uniref:CCHC-type domain-containing protein n=1 Tax=Austropuccinia psidii MF-1 TaxID=1389203 RepID=A0A9Q3IPC7_9BASI|nr:hypothetical protein [Austropuccinia psidii MF-1]
MAEVAKKKNSCPNCGSTDHYAKNCPKANIKIDSIGKSSEENSESDSMDDSITETSDDDPDPKEVLLVEYQEETQLEIQEIQLE